MPRPLDSDHCAAPDRGEHVPGGASPIGDAPATQTAGDDALVERYGRVFEISETTVRGVRIFGAVCRGYRFAFGFGHTVDEAVGAAADLHREWLARNTEWCLGSCDVVHPRECVCSWCKFIREWREQFVRNAAYAARDRNVTPKGE